MLTLPQIDNIFPTLETYGHSFGEGVANAAGASRYGHRWPDILAGMLNAKLYNFCANGGRVAVHESTGATPAQAGGWSSAGLSMVRVRNTITRAQADFPPESALQAFFHGINDAPFIGTAKLTANGPLAQGLRYLISRGRCSRVFPSNDASIVYTGTWTSDTSISHGMPQVAGGEAMHVSTVTGGVATITVPATFPGGTIAFFFTSDSTSGNNTCTIAKTAGAGTNATIFSSVGVSGPNVGDNSALTSGGAAVQMYGGICYRATNLQAGTHTFTLTFTNASGQVAVQGYGIEAPNPPAQLVFNQPKIPAAIGYGLWALTNSHGFQGTTDQGPVTDAMVNTLNGVIAGVVAEFDSACQLVDIDSVLAQNVAYWPSGDAHPNDTGHALIAQTAYTVLQRMVASQAVNVKALRAVTPWPWTTGDVGPAVESLVGIGSVKADLALLAGGAVTAYTLVANTELQMTGIEAFFALGDYTEFRVCANIGGTAVANARLYVKGAPVFLYQTLDGVTVVHPAYGELDVSATGVRAGPWKPIHPSYRRGSYSIGAFLFGTTAGTVSLYSVHVQFR